MNFIVTLDTVFFSKQSHPLHHCQRASMALSMTRGKPYAPVTAALQWHNLVFIFFDFTLIWVLAVFACSLFQLFLLIKKPNWE